jgi:hypothetical protein
LADFAVPPSHADPIQLLGAALAAPVRHPPTAQIAEGKT